MAHVEEYRLGKFRGIAIHPVSKRRKTCARHPDTGEPMSYYECEQWADRVERDMREGADVFGIGYRVQTTTRARKGTPTLAQWAEEWLTSVTRNPRTQKRYALDVRTIVSLPVAGKLITSIRRADVETSLLTMADRGLSENKIRTVLDRWRGIMRYAMVHEIIGADPTFGVTAPSTGVSMAREWCRIEDQDALILAAAMDADLWPAVLLGYDAGLRLGEVLGLTTGALDFRNRIVRVKAIVAEGEFIRVTKGRAARSVPMSGRLADALATHRDRYADRGSGLMFHQDGGPMAPARRLYPSWHRSTTIADLAEAHFHDLRHNFCTNLAEKGAPFRVIQRLAGHRSDRTTMKYVHHVESTDGGRQWIEGAA